MDHDHSMFRLFDASLNRQKNLHRTRQVLLPLVMTVGVVMVDVGIVVGRVGVGIVESFVERSGSVVPTKCSRRRNKCESSKIAQH